MLPVTSGSGYSPFNQNPTMKTNELNDGGPAFPMAASTGDPRDGVYCANGMSLRDWFAGMALQALITHDPTNYRVSDPNSRDIGSWFSEDAYMFADAMLAQREKGTV